MVKKNRNIIKQSFVAAQGKKSCHIGRSKFTLWPILSRLIQWVCFNFNPLFLSSPIARLQDFLQSASKQSEQAYRSYSKSRRSRLIKLFDLSMWRFSRAAPFKRDDAFSNKYSKHYVFNDQKQSRSHSLFHSAAIARAFSLGTVSCFPALGIVTYQFPVICTGLSRVFAYSYT